VIVGIVTAKPAFRLYELRHQIPFQAPCNDLAGGFFYPWKGASLPVLIFSNLDCFADFGCDPPAPFSKSVRSRRQPASARYRSKSPAQSPFRLTYLA
jgi:hypothetical protein